MDINVCSQVQQKEHGPFVPQLTLAEVTGQGQSGSWDGYS